jgi:hypothetical protein
MRRERRRSNEEHAALRGRLSRVSRAGKTKLDSWLDSVSTGLNASREDPTYQLRERLMRGVLSATREGMLEKFALMVKSWKLYTKKETVGMREFKWTATGKGAEAFPKVTGAKLKSYAEFPTPHPFPGKP